MMVKLKLKDKLLEKYKLRVKIFLMETPSLPHKTYQQKLSVK